MGMHRVARSTYLQFKDALSENRLRDCWWLFEQEVNTWDNWVSLPLQQRLWMLRHGFTSPFAKLYDFETYDHRAYLSELQRHRLYRSLNGRHRYLLDDKLSQHWMLATSPENRPTSHGLIDRGSVHGVADTEFSGEIASVSEWLPGILRRESKLVLKKLRGQAGKEVIICEFDDGYLLDGEPVTEAVLCNEIEELSGYLVSEHVTQHTYAADLYPNATNTIRVLTAWDDNSEELLVPMAVQRIGTDRSKPVDNCSVGGLTAQIDLETGELGRAAQFPFSGDVSWYATHPDTGAPIEGVRVPRWEAVRSTVERLARSTTQIPIIGWDILLDEAGKPVVIEANTGSGLDLLQVHRPLLTDARFATVVSRHLPEIEPPFAG